jgi:hypothetical protein
MHIVAQLRPIDLHNFQAKYQRVVSFSVPVTYPSLNELVSMPELESLPTQFRLPPNTSLLFLDLQGALFTPHLDRVEDHSEFYSLPEAFGHMSPHCRFSDLGPFIEPSPMAMNQIH